MSEHIIHVTDGDFEENVLNAEGPVLVDFWAEWCGPCKMIAPALDQIADEFEGKITVAKMDVDSSPVTPNQYGVRGIPTLMIFKDGQVVATKVGELTKSKLSEWLAEHTGGQASAVA